jgi:recombinational DNA repair protein RecR
MTKRDSRKKLLFSKTSEQQEPVILEGELHSFEKQTNSSAAERCSGCCSAVEKALTHYCFQRDCEKETVVVVQQKIDCLRQVKPLELRWNNGRIRVAKH